MLSIRPETPEDRDAVRRVNTLAFGQEDEADLVNRLRDEGYSKISLVAVQDNQIVGHVLFSDLPIHCESGIVHAVGLAPVSVLPENQRREIGSRLIRQGLNACRFAGHRIVIVLGEPDFYCRFGFSSKLTKSLDAPFSGDPFMAIELSPGALSDVRGTVEYPAPFGDLDDA